MLEQAAALFEGQRNWVNSSEIPAPRSRPFHTDSKSRRSGKPSAPSRVPLHICERTNKQAKHYSTTFSLSPCSNLANAASLLWHAFHALPAPSSSVNWAGFYVLDATAPRRLILGPFQGKVACQTIAFGRGVCGKAAAEGETVLVRDVEEFPGHIACDADSRSEIVVPVLNNKGEVSDGTSIG